MNLDKPITREEMYLSYLNGNTSITLPEPITRKDKYLYALCKKNNGNGNGNISVATKEEINAMFDDVIKHLGSRKENDLI